MLVVIEGVDGSGKQTQSQMLYDRLSEKMEVKRLAFPNYESDTSTLVKMYLGGKFFLCGRPYRKFFEGMEGRLRSR